jgi:hypothetical protein
MALTRVILVYTRRSKPDLVIFTGVDNPVENYIDVINKEV